MERLEKKIMKGHAYYYYSNWETVNGKYRRTWQKYLGKLEDIVKAVEGAAQVHNMRNSLTGAFPQFYGRSAVGLGLSSTLMLSAPNAARD